MDTSAIEAVGAKPLDATLQRVVETKNARELQTLAARLQQQGVGVLFRFTSNQDAKDSTQVIATALQGGLGLPERDYYLRDDEKSKKMRDDYAKHVAKMFELLGDSQEKAGTEATTVLNLETSLAKASMSNVDLRDPNKTYHRMKIAEGQPLTPDFYWESYLKTAGNPDVNAMNVSQPEFFKALDAQLTATPLEDWKTYFHCHLVESAAPPPPEKFLHYAFHFPA